MWTAAVIRWHIHKRCHMWVQNSQALWSSDQGIGRGGAAVCVPTCCLTTICFTHTRKCIVFHFLFSVSSYFDFSLSMCESFENRQSKQRTAALRKGWWTVLWTKQNLGCNTFYLWTPGNPWGQIETLSCLLSGGIHLNTDVFVFFQTKSRANHPDHSLSLRWICREIYDFIQQSERNINAVRNMPSSN